MSRELVIGVALALAIGLGGGYALAQVTVTAETENHDDDHSYDDNNVHMDHDMFIVSAEEAPAVTVAVEEDAKSGFNVSLDTENFTFTPENINGENEIGEGHAHLYVGGKKIARLYGPEFHYDESFDGTKTFRVTLNANDHSEYTVNGEVIDAEVDATHEAHN